MNSVTYVGNLTSDVELKQTTSGVSVCSFGLAVKRPHKNDVTDFFSCTAWRGSAESISRNFKKGDYISVTGYNIVSSYSKQVGNEKIDIPKVELVIERWGFCGSTKNTTESPQFAVPSKQVPEFETLKEDDDLPF